MSEPLVLHIRNSIDAAKLDKKKKKSLLTHLQKKIPSLHRAIELPKKNQSLELLNFSLMYIDYVADVLEAINTITQTIGLRLFTQDLIKTTESNFYNPPEFLLDLKNDLQKLLYIAYLTHRFFEEVSDRMVVLSGAPLAPIDMTVSNIIIHAIIGDKNANQLDQIVKKQVDRLFCASPYKYEKELQIYSAQLNCREYQSIFRNWPGFNTTSLINLRLHEHYQYKTIH